MQYYTLKLFSYKQKDAFLSVSLVNITLHMNFYEEGITLKLRN
jgi:hypothetical protein